MRGADEVASVLSLAAGGMTVPEIVAATSVPRSTVQRWIASQGRKVQSSEERCARCSERALDTATYAYLLGLYLGDGCIARQPNGTYRLEIYQDARYLHLIAAAAEAMEAVIPRRASVRKRKGSVAIGSYSNHWPCLLPQHGAGPKHLRTIALEEWQQEIVDAHPADFLKGLVESDGCRHINRVRRSQGGHYEYVRYSFSNRSEDIKNLFRHACVGLGVTVTATNAHGLAVSRRSDVAKLDEFIGPKS